MPLLNLVNKVGGYGLAESGEKLQPSIMSNGKLKEWKECVRNHFDGWIGCIIFIDIPLSFWACDGSLEEAKVNIVTNDVVGWEP